VKQPPKVTGRDNQPLAKVEWVDPSDLHANGYNPNHVAPVEMGLLKLSILEDGWTQPIVARADGEIVDGFHRWTLGRTDTEIQAMTDGLVPVVRLVVGDLSHQMMSTIRHNRARGQHRVRSMASIVREMRETLSEDEICRRLGMEPEEVERLFDVGDMVKRGSAEGFGRGWVPDDKARHEGGPEQDMSD
jgi:hypothetical protein